MAAEPQQNTGKVHNRTANLTQAGVGRSKGVPNKVTRELKEMILAALDNAGGEKYLAQQAIENPTAFMTLVGKVLPLTVNANVKATVALVQALPLDDSL